MGIDTRCTERGPVMVEVVFGDSAAGSLKMAQSYGKGAFEQLGSAVGVIMTGPNGASPTQQELEQAKKEFLTQERAIWQQAKPLGGNAGDVYGLTFGLSTGDISEDIPAQACLKKLTEQCETYFTQQEALNLAAQILEQSLAMLEAACSRIAQKQPLRIWYSDQPDELCGLYWLMDQLYRRGLEHGDISLVKLPLFDETKEGAVQLYTGWGGVHPGDFHRFCNREEVMTQTAIKHYASRWQRLKAENAPLRGALNGQLVSMPETLYDHFILREIQAQEPEFQQATVIGSVLGNYNLGIGDAWVAKRMQEMIDRGLLRVVTPAEEGNPVYHRRLRKCTSALALDD